MLVSIEKSFFQLSGTFMVCDCDIKSNKIDINITKKSKNYIGI